jgi:GH25 family lysozyme M1 (1,4-beta-N-acetylmuramidase)
MLRLVGTVLKRLLLALVPLVPFLLNSCGGGGYGSVGLMDAPKVVNVSSFDPKEKQRPGDSYSTQDVSALRRNGAHGLIARTGKGTLIDEKCADFLSAANREGMLLGTYYFVLKTSDPVWQADRYVSRLREIAAQRGLQGRKILLVGDFDTKSSASDIVRFIDRIEQLTGVLPVIYLENSGGLRATLSNATPAEKRRIRQCPYWIALYNHTNGFRTPTDLMKAYGIWDEWAMWQYGGVEWGGGRSNSKHYNHGPWRAPQYFGTMDRPLEHNAFNGSVDDLRAFWAKHSWQPR